MINIDTLEITRESLSQGFEVLGDVFLHVEINGMIRGFTITECTINDIQYETMDEFILHLQ